MVQKKFIIALAAVAMLPISVRTVNAESFSIASNGDNSSSTLSVSQSQQNTVEQKNDAQVDNQVQVNADTGNNSASSNTGGNDTIQTGDSSISTTISNTANQSATDSITCCQVADSKATIANNGADTTNTISGSSNITNAVTVNQYATITNSVSGNINTGGNSADRNNGNVSIETGSITVAESIKNTTNQSQVNLGVGGNQGFSLFIKGNGAGSTNTISLNQDSNNIVVVNNVADIFNRNVWNLITGNNSADRNNGDVSIKTGDIKVTVDIENDINISRVTIDCGDCRQTPPPPCEGEGCNPPPPPCQGDSCNPTPPPTTTTTPNPGGGSNPPSSGSVLGTTTGSVLPATGNPWMLLAILGNLLMLLFGAVLRLRSGRSPGASIAI